MPSTPQRLSAGSPADRLLQHQQPQEQHQDFSWLRVEWGEDILDLLDAASAVDAVASGSLDSAAAAESTAAVLRVDLRDEVCVICSELLLLQQEIASLPTCSHLFCFACLYKWASISSRCPLCAASFTTIVRRRGPPFKGSPEVAKAEAIEQQEQAQQQQAHISPCKVEGVRDARRAPGDSAETPAGSEHPCLIGLQLMEEVPLPQQQPRRLNSDSESEQRSFGGCEICGRDDDWGRGRDGNRGGNKADRSVGDGDVPPAAPGAQPLQLLFSLKRTSDSKRTPVHELAAVELPTPVAGVATTEAAVQPLAER
ncbi:PHD-zinc finger (c3hc4 type) domain-containing protein [Cyclospora cayetanensis]|uniref:PHD-zinc finger (C3hc4 type) domain-containing protein n=1 Tax=Cyclospora cayetanensis TaxID=88456 RepID=A0A1D3DA68_9EIME|nr:PHD-zinc finger (c3hc4 type) domain-containing protein [Cyclospora cayetanensis]